METLPVAPQPLDLLDLNEGEMTRLVRQLGWPAYRARQILRWLYQSRETDIRNMTDLSQEDRRCLSAHATISTPKDVRIMASDDGTHKFLLTLADGRTVESVLIPDDDRLTLCLSTQVGCTLDCGFCLTGTMGLQRNLRSSEILMQVLTVQKYCPTDRSLTNLVFMGMGEPLANISALSTAIHCLTNHTWGFGFSPRRITVSTAGLAGRLKDVAALGVNLAVSLNATTDDLRQRLMPAAAHLYPLGELLAACRAYPLPPHRRLTFEYVLLDQVNDWPEDARRLVTLLRGIRCKVNLISFNAFPGSLYRRPADSRVAAFQEVLRRSGLDVYVRRSRGRDVLGACGQLGQVPSQAPVALTQIQGRC